jgi:organic hydroperoxide reductase OsmC/OhrA
MDEVDGAHRIVGSEVHARVRVQGIGDALLARAATAADAGCPLSALIRASGTVTVEARLEGGNDGD